MTLNQNNKKHLIYISYDAFSEDNWEMASRLPNLSILLKNGAYSTKLKSVYPPAKLHDCVDGDDSNRVFLDNTII